MIHKNINLGPVENVTFLQFGRGDIAMTVFLNKPEHTGVGLGFANSEPHVIGDTDDSMAGKTLAEIAPEVYMHFNSIDSIDVVIERLQAAKALFESNNVAVEAASE